MSTIYRHGSGCTCEDCGGEIACPRCGPIEGVMSGHECPEDEFGPRTVIDSYAPPPRPREQDIFDDLRAELVRRLGEDIDPVVDRCIEDMRGLYPELGPRVSERSRTLIVRMLDHEEEMANDYHEGPAQWIEWAEEIDGVRAELGIPLSSRVRVNAAGEMVFAEDGFPALAPSTFADYVRSELREMHEPSELADLESELGPLGGTVDPCPYCGTTDHEYCR